jgi:tetratricopeptide (TPR) repeat protein
MTRESATLGTGPQSKAKIFISYSRKDIAFADRLEAALKARSFEPLIDRADIYAFEEWWTRIETLIAGSDTVAFVLSPDSIASDIALKEISFAASLNKRFAPIVYRRVDHRAVPEPLAKLNFEFFDDDTKFESNTDRLADALNTDIAWIRQHTEFGEQARRWTSARQSTGLLLRSPVLEHAERWIASRPRGAPAPTEETQAFIRQSRQAATRRRNMLTGSLAAGLVVAVGLAGLAYWQRSVAIEQRGIAEQNAATAERNAEEARTQKSIAERETVQATRQAARSDARAELIQSQLILHDTPREALRRGYNAAQKLDQLGFADEALSLLSSVLNSARELPALRAYDHYPLVEAMVFARQTAPKPLKGAATSSPRQLLTIVGTNDVTGIIDDQGHAAGRPIDSSDSDRSYTNDAAWLDEEHFILATGEWKKTNTESNEFVLLNAALTLYRAEGRLVQEYLVGHSAPVTSVSVLEHQGQRIILAGDAAGNLIVRPIDGGISIIPTGINAPVIKIAVQDVSGGRSGLVLVFGRFDPERMPSPSDQTAALEIAAQKGKIQAALELPVAISYLGNRPGQDFSCAVASEYALYTCDGKSIVILQWDFDTGLLREKPEYSFTAHTDSVTAIAFSPSSPILATGSRDGQIRLWLRNGTMIAELPANQQGAINALGFMQDGRRLLSSSSATVRVWDLEDLAGQLMRRVSGPEGDDWMLQEFRQVHWVRFLDQSDLSPGPDLKRLHSLIEESGRDTQNFRNYGRYLIAGNGSGLRVIDTSSITSRNVRLAAEPRIDADGNVNREDDTQIASGASTTACVLHGSNDPLFPNKQQENEPSATRRLYAINQETGAILAEWTLPPELRRSFGVSLASETFDDQTTCVAAGQQSILLFYPKDGSSQVFRLPLPSSDTIEQVVPLNGEHAFLVAAGNTSGPTTVMRAELSDSSSGKADAPTEAAVSAAIKLNGMVDRIAASTDGALIAIATKGGQYSNAVADVRLFDKHFNILLVMPGAPNNFREFQFSPDGTKLRGSGYDFAYEQDLGLASRLETARARLTTWTEENDRVGLNTIVTSEKDQEKAKSVLRDALERHPFDATFLLLLANREFYTAKGGDDRNRALELYDQANSLDPYEPIAHYMRGKARALVGNSRGAVDDFNAAIELPHILPQVKVIPGSLGLNQGIAALSRQLNLQSKAELYSRRALAHAVLADWRSAVDDIHWVRQTTGEANVLGYEVEAFALDKLGGSTAAIVSYELAVTALGEGKYYGLEEFEDQTKDQTWRTLKLAIYKHRIGDIYERIGQPENGAAAHAAAEKLIVDAYSQSDLTPQSKALLDQSSHEPPEQRCAAQNKFKSVQSIEGTQIRFVNRYPSAVRLNWLDYSGERKLYATINPGATFTQSTFLTHPWLISDLEDKCISISLPEVGQSEVAIH